MASAEYDCMKQGIPRDMRMHDCHSIHAFHIARTHINAPKMQVQHRTVSDGDWEQSLDG